MTFYFKCTKEVLAGEKKGSDLGLYASGGL